VTQSALIEIAVQLRMRLVVMDAAFAERGEQSAHDARQYLAWANTLARTLSRLGLHGVKNHSSDLTAYLGSKLAAVPAGNSQTVDGASVHRLPVQEQQPV
jgi:hypothetical protein